MIKIFAYKPVYYTVYRVAPASLWPGITRRKKVFLNPSKRIGLRSSRPIFTRHQHFFSLPSIPDLTNSIGTKLEHRLIYQQQRFANPGESPFVADNSVANPRRSECGQLVLPLNPKHVMHFSLRKCFVWKRLIALLQKKVEPESPDRYKGELKGELQSRICKVKGPLKSFRCKAILNQNS